MTGPSFPLPFYLQAGEGKRFCVLHAPLQTPSSAWLYVPPFGEEMNKSRRMVSLQAQALAVSGVAVLVMDLHGCGDSEGELRDTRWETWHDDLHLGLSWLSTRFPCPVGLWGLRLGALLALDFLGREGTSLPCVLWQPVFNGSTFLTQFLRLRVAASMASGNTSRITTQMLREKLLQGEILEIGGYDLNPALSHALDHLHIVEPPPLPIHWFELQGPQGLPAPATQRLLESWQARGAPVMLHSCAGEPFWQTQEITDCPDLLAQSTEQMAHVLR
jgi:exosortase A-associated hydrolase 2